MTDTVHEVASAAPPAAPRDPARTRRWLLALVLALLAAAVVAVWLDGRNARRQLRTEVAMRLSALDAADQTTRASLKDAQEDLRETQAKLTLLESRLAESQNQQTALEAIYRELATSRDEWVMTDTEQVLKLATQRFYLERCVTSSLPAHRIAYS